MVNNRNKYRLGKYSSKVSKKPLTSSRRNSTSSRGRRRRQVTVRPLLYTEIWTPGLQETVDVVKKPPHVFKKPSTYFLKTTQFLNLNVLHEVVNFKKPFDIIFPLKRRPHVFKKLSRADGGGIALIAGRDVIRSDNVVISSHRPRPATFGPRHRTVSLIGKRTRAAATWRQSFSSCWKGALRKLRTSTQDFLFAWEERKKELELDQQQKI
ncbi:unnamed protein product [Caenorhabditis auriculariae]|uniref:Uncharacterized protein n=1 Tax=Caenorhabditis auriculariae TaxID=2777116 RepID=A0A8S1HT58_9PELO|nr:unnamed protein product [Caenorhabditis auriculariae]